MADDTRAAKAAAAVTHAPVDLAILKDDLGIAAGDASQDAWLQRRVDGVWARMEAYTFRKLCAPQQAFVDDWGKLVDQHYVAAQPPVIAYPRRGSIFLRYFPVVSIDAVVLNDQDLVAADARFDPVSGKLFTLSATQLAHDLGHELVSGRARITYQAGWPELPPDLYECLLGVMQTLWMGRQSQAAGMGVGGINRVSVIDVGDVEVGRANPFVESALRGAGAVADPLLGPYANLLDLYTDHRTGMGLDIFPTTTAVVVAP
jgi:hypothetical protein